MPQAFSVLKFSLIHGQPKTEGASPPSNSSTAVCTSRTHRGKDRNWSSAYFKDPESELCVCCRNLNSLGSQVSRHQQKTEPAHFLTAKEFGDTSLDLERGENEKRRRYGGGNKANCCFSQDHAQTHLAVLSFAQLLCCNMHDLHYNARWAPVLSPPWQDGTCHPERSRPSNFR